ncbi:hypothetical protein [Spirillospora sp. NPDC048819]|uniref:hypothetical protein n=1 Tax=Spirillospora sp. NPDC048819 TaxID=3155268 RepID=UPI0033E6BF74
MTTEERATERSRPSLRHQSPQRLLRVTARATAQAAAAGVGSTLVQLAVWWITQR